MSASFNALVTGTSRGLGLEIVRQLVAKSHINLVFATGRSDPTPELQKTIDSSSGRVVYLRFDPVKIDDVRATLDTVKEKLAGASLDLLINNVGSMPFTPEGIASMNDLTETFNVNVLSAHNVTSVFLPLMEKSSLKKIMNISTTLGSLALAPRYQFFSVPAYKITKAALNMLTVQYALEYAERGYIFISLSPGVSIFSLPFHSLLLLFLSFLVLSSETCG
ncbi:short chain oxidoreductase [Phlyctema vagabunda]|uniref:Short chain oxidoreductase n=1 Tax=Phlyctema vagabunda TaxID=108571 RepID=A0ABR4PWK9_9HELO